MERPRGLSIRIKLFLLIGGLIAVVATICSWAAYRETKSTAVELAASRLGTIGDQWSQLLVNALKQQHTQSEKLGALPLVSAYLQHPNAAHQKAALAVLNGLTSRNAQGPVVQLYGSDQHELLRVGKATTWGDGDFGASLAAEAAKADSGVTGALRMVDSTVVYGTARRIQVNGQLIGYVVQWRQFAVTKASRDQTNKLLGTSTTRGLIANRSGDVWTDLSTRVAPPPVKIASALTSVSYTRKDGVAVIAMPKAVPGTPWLVLIELPRAEVLTEAHHFLVRLLLIGLVLLAIGAAGAFALSVSLVRPLDRLTRAAEAVSAGDYAQHVGLIGQGDEVGRLAVVFDAMVSRIQESFAARAASEETHRQLFEAVPLPLWVHDQNTFRILTVNEAATRHYGYSREEFLSMTIIDLLPSEDVSRFRAFVSQPVELMPHAGTWRQCKKNGSIMDVETSAHSIDFDGHKARIVVIMDVTERNRTLLAIQQAEEKYRSLIREAPYGIALSSLNGRYSSANPAFVEMLGYTNETEVLALNAGLVYADPEEFARLQKQLEEQSQVRRSMALLRRKDNELITVQFAARIVTDSVTGEQFIETVSEDVTEERKIERQVQQAQKMEAVGKLAGGVAHDFNNLLTVILSYADLLLSGLPENAPERADIEAIRKAGESASSLTRQLLVFSRQQVLQPKVMKLNDLVTGTSKMLGRLIGENIELATALDPEVGTVRVDAGQIEQVIVNLAVNARDAMPNGGKLLIESRNVEFHEGMSDQWSLYPAGRYVSLVVSDTGIGMSEETRLRIFEPFFTTKEAGRGTGLGLATVYGIVKQSDGHIVVYSEPGHGTSFKIYFPRVDTPTEAESLANVVVTPAPRGHESVLVVEDEPALRLIVHRVLSAQGYNILQAEDGESAIELISHHEGAIHLLVTDVVMPRMGGRVLADHVAKLRPGIPVLFVSGYTDDAVVHHGVLSEGMHYLQKPFTPDQLARKVREVLDTVRS